MKSKLLLPASAIAAGLIFRAQAASQDDPPETLLPPPPVAAAPARPAPPQVYVYEQHAIAEQPFELVTADQAKTIIDHFKSGYAKLGSPRILIYVNRDLATARPQPAGADALADKQTARDVERLFGRPLRLAGVNLVDQVVASQTQPEVREVGSAPNPEADQIRRNREALSKIADVVVEVLISSRSVIVPDVGGDKPYSLPDIQATAVRLSDAKIIGQATAAEVLNKHPLTRVARHADVNAVTEATALAVMEDMALGNAL